MYFDKDGWPMLSWYDHAFVWARNTGVTLGWRIYNLGAQRLGRWIVDHCHQRSGMSGEESSYEDDIKTMPRNTVMTLSCVEKGVHQPEIDRLREENKTLVLSMAELTNRFNAAMAPHVVCSDVLVAAYLARSALDRLMGDSNYPEHQADSIEVRAMQALSAAIAKSEGRS